ncbi:MAG: SPASM domain-containing protein [Theionarchaea archaeon]|nr:MAG: hypothetical protein AYK18_13615 [Theionarchaea archaeon DG-70]MBU7012336.1 SPASM domain-containing protein [Theionarchaea archaeon]
MYFPTVRKMLFEHNDTVLIFDPETVRIWKGDSDTGKILAMVEEGKSIPEMSDVLNRSESSVSEEVEDMRQKGILGKQEKKKGSTIFSVNPLFHGIFTVPLPSKILRKGAAYLARLSKKEGENEAVFTGKMDSPLNPDELDAVREILDEVSVNSHTDLLFSLNTSPQYVENALDARIDHITIEVSNSEYLPLLESLVDTDMVSVRVAGERREDVRTTVSALESMGFVNFEMPYDLVDLHADFLERLSFENFSQTPLSDKLVDLLVSILSRRPVREPHCTAGVRTFFCNAKGEVYPCDRAQQEQYSLGILAPAYDHKDSPFSNSLRQYTQEECSECWTRNLCGGGCFLQQTLCSKLQRLAGYVIYQYPKIIGEMKKKMAEAPSADRLELVVDILERIRQNYVFSWCKLR